MKEFYLEQGMVHQRRCVETPKHNGRVERKHQHILNIIRALKFQNGLKTKYWSYFILTAVYLINRTPSSAIDHKTPFEILLHSRPTCNHLRVFRCLAFVSTANQ